MTATKALLTSNRLSMEQQRTRLYAACWILDLVSIVAGFLLGDYLKGPHGLEIGGVSLLYGLLPAYTVFALICGAYSVRCLTDFNEAARATLAALGATAIIMLTFAFFAQVSSVISRLALVYAVFLSGAFILTGRALVSAFIRWRMGDAVERNLLIVEGKPIEIVPGCDVIDAQAHGILPDLAQPDSNARLGELVEPYDRVFLDVSETYRDAWVTALKATGVAAELLVPTQAIHGAVGLGHFGNADTLILSLGPLSLASRAQKRAFDLALTIPILIFLAPLLIVVAIAIRLDSPGPALFAQTRIGRSNRPFRIYKFRSMSTDKTDHDGKVSASRGDKRVTRVGRFIRATSIDELPQLFNVLIGNMSLVGPRPHATASTAGDQLFWEVSQHYWMRHASKPGITGLAQVRGFRGNTERPEDLEARLRSDLEYLQNWSFWRDLVILFATVKVISHDNAY
ncbi:MAG: exopolysaccharide biosynthesis polyprenyl glycosylphosphotransferase [Sphingomonas sp.]|uniref:exopolysaccharide biosynthesis polyprenyl glycosylphosphotransferase n=1 Tax=Sphingomonas sp. TaxID=28214 RepID=UPI001AC62149|nr:exopolysaccharide biosynthesis polyprenyl glycosylphosphotransferase [Sphingomonas sp.]MBN8808851.1 exopolysaccharide biosynthesis polyprenyl glycosylphosphotransferase [Sphingomonas sp.]